MNSTSADHWSWTHWRFTFHHRRKEIKDT